jgi:hypothetical protein
MSGDRVVSGGRAQTKGIDARLYNSRVADQRFVCMLTLVPIAMPRLADRWQMAEIFRWDSRWVDHFAFWAFKVRMSSLRLFPGLGHFLPSLSVTMGLS